MPDVSKQRLCIYHRTALAGKVKQSVACVHLFPLCLSILLIFVPLYERFLCVCVCVWVMTLSHLGLKVKVTHRSRSGVGGYLG